MTSEQTRQQARETLGKHARSFRWASFFLPRSIRDDAAVVYTFCRMVDDAVDEVADPVQAASALGAIQAALSRLSSHNSELISAFVEVASRTGIDRVWVDDLIAGVRSDMSAVRIRDDGELRQYCYRVAGTVGLMMCRVMKVRERGALACAVDLGIAMQLTNICRDVLEDSQKDRVYLPETRLRQSGTSQRALVEHRADPDAVSRVVLDLLQLAEEHYQRAERGISYIPWKPRLAIFIASRLYRAIGRRIVHRLGGNAMAGRAVVPWYHKLYWLGVASCAWVNSLVAEAPRLTVGPKDGDVAR
jgi:15-cis-phytoene synthase